MSLPIKGKEESAMANQTKNLDMENICKVIDGALKQKSMVVFHPVKVNDDALNADDKSGNKIKYEVIDSKGNTRTAEKDNSNENTGKFVE